MPFQSNIHAFKPADQEGLSIIAHEGRHFRVIKPGEEVDVEVLRSIDAVIIDCGQKEAPSETIRLIRSHPDREIYLKPIFLHNAGEEENVREITVLTDRNVLSTRRLEEAAHVTNSILEKVEKYSTNQAVDFEDEVLTRLFRYLVSRGKNTLEPIPSRTSKLGYTYPIMDINYHYEDEHKSVLALEAAEGAGLLNGQFVDAWYVCSNCAEGTIHYREICPECGIADLKEEDLVHHFRCAYVGPLSDFTLALKMDELRCPKCKRKLNHIGVDYDKPSTIFTCRNNHVFQNARVKAKCFTCDADNHVEDLPKRVFKRYTLTRKGAEAARTGVTMHVRNLTEITGAVDRDTFNMLLRYEIERGKVARAQSNLGVIHFGRLSDLFSFIGLDERSSLLVELVRLVNERLGASDVVSFADSEVMVCLVTSMNSRKTKQALEAAAAEWKAIVADHHHGYEAKLGLRGRVLRTHKSAEEQLAKLIERTDSDA